jgi:hypothetical protein
MNIVQKDQHQSQLADDYLAIEMMRITDYLAIWGAVVATMVAGWNIYKDFLKRHA